MREIVVVFVVALAACSGPGSVTTQQPNAETPTGPVVHSDYETFDASTHRNQAVTVDHDLSHDVPTALMEDRADAGVEQSVAGYRVQVMATLDPVEADAMERRVRLWWDRQAPGLDPESSLPRQMEVYKLFRQPYYRIRVGDLTRRVQAEELLAVVAADFDGAFIVPDQVTVRKEP